MKTTRIFYFRFLVLMGLVISLVTLVTSQSLLRIDTAVPKVLIPTDGSPNDFFGSALAVKSGTMIVGALGSDPLGVNSGAAYIFRRKGGEWNQQAMLVPEDGEDHAWFGCSVDVDGRRAVVGAYGRFEPVSTGAVYVFRRKGASWKEEAKIMATDTDIGDHIGCAVAISGKTIVAGAFGKGDAGKNSGAAYVFRRINGIWIQEAKLTAVDAAPRKQFGRSVAIDRNKIVIGGDSSAYVFEREGGQWIQKIKLERTGQIVAIDGKTIVTGKPLGYGNVRYSGVVSVYTRRGGSWIRKAVLSASDAADHDRFGDSVSIDGDTIAIGAWGDTPSGDFSGSAYVFRFQNNEWIQKKKLTSPLGEPHDYFGASVGVSGRTIVVGATSAKGAMVNSGAVFVFK